MNSYSSKTTSRRPTRGLLFCGVILAPLFYAVVLVQAFTREGFDIRRAPLSLLSLGNLGWIQIANFILAGLLALACALGIRRALAGRSGGTFGPLLMVTYGLGLIVAGVFHPDPGYHFPPGVGAPAEMLPVMSDHAKVHSLGFVIVVLSLIAACLVFARGFRSRGQRGWSVYSATTGIVTPVLLVSTIATNTVGLIIVMGMVSFGWVSVVAARLRSDFKLVAQ